MFTIIAAVGMNREIGAKGRLIWHLPKDLEFFKKMTINHPMVMGRHTFESLPGLLPEREHIVISEKRDNFPQGVLAFKSIQQFLSEYDINKDIFVIGGENIYREFLMYTSKMYLTEIKETCHEADRFFPYFDQDFWNKEYLSFEEEKGIQYVHTIYRRKTNL